MPVKRKQADTLTGGTGDVNPQNFVITHLFEIPANTTQINATAQPLPIPRYPIANGRAMVMELLEVEWNVLNAPSLGATDGSIDLLLLLSTDGNLPGTALLGLQSPRNISIFRRAVLNFTLAAGQSRTPIIMDLSEEDNLTDHAGHGILVATDNLWIKLVGSATGAGTGWVNSACVVNITYRMKEVTLSEYIGIVQSQQ